MYISIYVYSYYRRNRIDRVGLIAIFVKMRTFVTMAQMEAKILQVCSQWKNMINLIQLQHEVVLWQKVKTFFFTPGTCTAELSPPSPRAPQATTMPSNRIAAKAE